MKLTLSVNDPALAQDAAVERWLRYAEAKLEEKLRPDFEECERLMLVEGGYALIKGKPVSLRTLLKD